MNMNGWPNTDGRREGFKDEVMDGWMFSRFHAKHF